MENWQLKNGMKKLRNAKYIIIVLYMFLLMDQGGLKEHTVYFVLLGSFVCLVYTIQTKGFLMVEGRQSYLWKCLILTGTMITIPLGIDKGESVHGFFRLAAILAAGIAIQQLDGAVKKFFLKMLPVMGMILLAVSVINAMMAEGSWVSPSGRINEAFGYSNTMALFLLLGIIVAEHLFERGKRICQFILMAGLLGTGSRTAFVLLCGYMVFSFVRYQGKNRKVFVSFLGMVALVCLITFMGGNLYGLNRFLKISIGASTFQGRLLYWEDAVRMLMKRPWGLGYMGYFYFQQAEQTGVYSVRFVHNDWMQWVLDYGILAGAGLVGYLYCQCRQNRMYGIEKELLIAIAVYSFFDFHLQFFSIVFIVLLLIPSGTIEWNCRQKLRKYGILAMTVVSAGLCFCTVIAERYAGLNEYGKAIKWNPLSAQYKQEYLLQSEDLKSAEIYADIMLKNNDCLYVVYLLKSNAAAEEGRLDDFIINRKKMLKFRKYKTEEYEEYFAVLYGWYLEAYSRQDLPAMQKCLEAMAEIPDMILEVRQKTSVRAYQIQDKPDLNFKREYIALLNELEEKWNESYERKEIETDEGRYCAFIYCDIGGGTDHNGK